MNLKSKKGSISIFVLVTLLFMSAFLIISFANNVNKSKIAKEQFNIISGIYSYTGGDQGAYDKVYTDLRNKNKQTLTTFSENSNVLELSKTFNEDMSNCRIYGNSVQNGEPSVRTPVKIESVGDKTKNIWDFNDSFTGDSREHNGITYTKTEDGIIVNGTATAQSYTNPYEIINDLEIGKSYTISLSDINQDSIIPIIEYVEDGTRKYNRTINLTENISSVSIYFYINPGETVDNVLVKMQFQEGSVATEYEPYNKYKILVKVNGKNLFNINELEVGTLNVYGNEANHNSRCRTEFVFLKPGTYTFSKKETEKAYTKAYMYDLEKNKINNLWDDMSTQHTFSIEEECYIRIALDDTLDIIKNADVQLEKGNIKTKYEYCGETITTNIFLNEPLRKVGDYADYIDFKTGRVVRNVSSCIMSNNRGFNGTSEDRILIMNAQNSVLRTSNAGMSMIWKYENPKSNINTALLYPDNGFFYWYPDVTAFGVNFGDDNATIKDPKLQEWLAKQTDEIKTIYYVLATPDDSEVVSLPQLKTFEDYTNINVLTQITPSKIEAEYKGYTLD